MQHFENPYRAPNDASQIKSRVAQQSRLLWILWHGIRPLLAPIVGSVAGLVGSGVIGMISGFVEFAGMGWGTVVEALFGSVYLGLVSAVYGTEVGFFAGLATMPIIYIARRHRTFDTVLIGVFSGIIAIFVFSSSAFWPTNWEPDPVYLLPRVFASALASGAVVWILGRK